MIVVMGLYRGGSSCVAGVLHHLGVCMGHEVKRIPAYAQETDPYVCWEDWPMRRTTLACYTEREIEPRLDFSRRVRALKRYLRRRQTETAEAKDSPNTLVIPRHDCPCSPIGVKDPMLCLMGEEIVQAWGPHVRFVAVDRDIDVAAKSAARWYGKEADGMTRALYEARERFLDGRPHTRVCYERLVADPADRVERLARSLELNPSGKQLTSAMASVRRPGSAVPA